MWSLVLTALTLLLATTPALAADAAVSFAAIEESLTCQCGCGLTVRSCNHIQCPSALPLRDEIREQIAKGLDQRAILAYFAVKYGEKILSSPTTRGFNLTAWIAPFAVVGTGTVFVVLTLLRWKRRERAKVLAVPAVRSVDDARSAVYEKLLENELDRFDG